jgi:replicative superfamily II helicase
VSTSRISTFGGADLVATLLRAIESANRRVWLVVPWWNRIERPHAARLFDAVAGVARRGIDVRVMLRNEASNIATIDALRGAGVEVRPVRYVHYKELHVDDRALSFSANFTGAELGRNQNVGFELSGDDRAAAESAFLSLWGANTNDDVAAGEEMWTSASQVVPGELLPLLGREKLNPLQAKALPLVFGTQDHLLIVAPTGAGKTDIGEAAVLRAIKLQGRRAVYITPARALTGELSGKFNRWRQHGIKVLQLTGEDEVNLADVHAAELWVATTEKFESLCRRASLDQAIANVGCIVVDEIHFLGSPGRGPTLEALLARLRNLAGQTRIVGLSATVANANEVADWLNARLVKSEWRPVQLSIQVVGFEPGRTARETHDAKNEALRPIVNDVVASGGQVVVFCGSKFNARSTAAFLADLRNPSLDDGDGIAAACVEAGIGLHYAGLVSKNDAERDFRSRKTKVLVATSGLGQGINLPARATVVRDTVLGQTPLSVGDALQMLGRAGRHGQETEGFGFLLAPDDELAKWRGGLADGHSVHSQILDSLADHILADVLLRRVGSVGELRGWFSATFAAFEGNAGDAPLDTALELLLTGGFLTRSGTEGMLACTELGALTSRFLVEVPAASALLAALREASPTDEAEDAERTVLVAIATMVPAFSNAACPSRALDELNDLLSATPYRNLAETVGAGSRKALFAAHVALNEPSRLSARAKVGPFPVAEMVDLCSELPRYLSWIGALGTATMLGWLVPVASDLAARVEWRKCGPTRGAGRLLRHLFEMLPVDARRREMPELYRRALRRGKRSPNDIVEKPVSQQMTDAQWEGLAARTVQVSISDVVVHDSELVVTATGSTGQGLVVVVAANAGRTPTTVRAANWGGAPLRLLIPNGAIGGEVAVDLLAFGRYDWAYDGGTWPCEVAEDTELTLARRIVSDLPAAAITQTHESGWRRALGWMDRRQRKQISRVVETPQPYLRALAHHLAGSGSLQECAYGIQSSLAKLLTLSPQDGFRPPARVLRSGVANKDELSITLVCLLRSLDLEAGLGLEGGGSLVPVILQNGTWFYISSIGRVVHQLAPVSPRHLPKIVPALPTPPPSSSLPVAPRIAVLREYMKVAEERDQPSHSAGRSAK